MGPPRYVLFASWSLYCLTCYLLHLGFLREDDHNPVSTSTTDEASEIKTLRVPGLTRFAGCAPLKLPSFTRVDRKGVFSC
ncbi:hypothetical protein E2320_006918 [Naja naja]|nr:hypothetical protein E2320_006918 [Naja naja]